MSNRLSVETFRNGVGVKVWKVSGFSQEELYRLEHEDYRDMKQDVLNLLDERNSGLGSTWYRGYGVFSMFTNQNYPGCIFVETGNNCD